MKKEELRSCFAQIQPEEELIEAALHKMEQAAERQETRRRPAFRRWYYGFAAAACILALSAGIWRMAEQQIHQPQIIFSREREEMPEQYSLRSAESELAEELAAKAEKSDADYLLFSGKIDRTYTRQDTEWAVLQPDMLIQTDTPDSAIPEEIKTGKAFPVQTAASEIVTDTRCLILLQAETGNESNWVLSDCAVIPTEK